MPGLLYADDLYTDLRAIMERFVEVCRRIGLKVNAGNLFFILLWFKLHLGPNG